MNIKIGNYNLTSDACQFIVSETKTNNQEGSKHFGEEYESNYTYHPTIESALNGVLKRRLRASDATTLEQLKKELQEHRRELQGILKESVVPELVD